MERDNFDVIAKMMKHDKEKFLSKKEWDENDLFYYVVIMARKKDNIELHGNSLNIKEYLLESPEELLERKNEIKKICTLLHARAYISPNLKSLERCSCDALVRFTERIRNRDFRKPQAVVSSAINSISGCTKHLIVDIDDTTEYSQYMKILTEDMGIDESEIFVVPTRTGVHLITPRFYKEKAAEKLDKIGGNYEIKQNALTVLYCNLLSW